MSRTIFTSMVLHLFLIAMLLIGSLIHSRPKLKVKQEITIRFVTRTPTPTPRPPTPTPTPRVTPRVTPTPTPTPTPTRTPTPTPNKTKTPTPKPTKTPTPKPTKTPTPRPTKTPTPRKTITPTPTPTKTPLVVTTPTPTPTPRKAITPTPTPLPERSINVVSEKDLPEYYMASARERIRENFLIYRGKKQRGITAELQFTILRDGTIRNIELVKSTGDPQLDSLAYNALKITGKLMPLPDGIRANQLTVRVTFNYEF